MGAACRRLGHGTSIDTRLVQDALAMAYPHHRPPEGLVFHSDRGVQYASGDFRDSLQKGRLVPSMSCKGNCYDNGAMEAFGSIAQFYDTRRLHSSIGYLSPADFEATF